MYQVLEANWKADNINVSPHNYYPYEWGRDS